MSKWIEELVRADVATAIKRIGTILDCPRQLSEEQWTEVMVLGCSLNNTWPPELQDSLATWINALVPIDAECEKRAATRRLLRALFWSLYKQKRSIAPVDSVEIEFWKFPEKADLIDGAHEHAALVVTTRDEATAVGAMLALSRAYYRLHEDPEFRGLMMEVLDWTARKPGSPLRAIVSVVHAVHTEFDKMQAETVRVLTGAHHLGPFLPFWALFQIDDSALLELRNRNGISPNASALTKAVFEALCCARLDLP